MHSSRIGLGKFDICGTTTPPLQPIRTRLYMHNGLRIGGMANQDAQQFNGAMVGAIAGESSRQEVSLKWRGFDMSLTSDGALS